MMSCYPACREHRPGIEPGLFPYHGNAIAIILSVRTKWKRTYSKRCFITDLTIIEHIVSMSADGGIRGGDLDQSNPHPHIGIMMPYACISMKCNS